MAGPRDLRVNFERMWREMDELLGDPFAERASRLTRAQSGFSPRVRRPTVQTEGRVYQQIEIEAGPFRLIVELGADVVAEAARASYDDGILRVELPLAGQTTRRVPIERSDV